MAARVLTLLSLLARRIENMHTSLNDYTLLCTTAVPTQEGTTLRRAAKRLLFGMRHTAAWKKRHSEQMRGHNHPLFGTHCSAETKERMSRTKKGRLVRTDVSTHELGAKYAEGLTTRDLAAMFHMQRKSVQTRLHSAGVKMRQSGRRKQK